VSFDSVDVHQPRPDDHPEPVPDREWVALDAVTLESDRGIGFAESALFDEQGRIGRSVQSLLFDGP
jgi:hypothetical protein